MQASIIIPSYGRSDSLERCFRSLKSQTVKPYEIIVKREQGELAKIRNQGAKEATGEILVFIDDDVFCTRHWLSEIIQTFKTRDVSGVTGPSIIPNSYRANRDIFRYEKIKAIYDSFFLEGRQSLPGHFTRAGAWTTGASNAFCSYDGEVEFLEACNSAYRTDVFRLLGGFDENFRGIGDWSEPDLSFRIRKLGHKLWFNPRAALYHEPSRNGAFGKRKSDRGNRMTNYLLFSERWIKPCFKHSLYKLFLHSYYALKTFK